MDLHLKLQRKKEGQEPKGTVGSSTVSSDTAKEQRGSRT